MRYCVLMHRGIPLIIHDNTDAYVMRQENDHYVYHITAMTVAIRNGCPASTATKECSLNHKGAQEVWEPTSESILALVDHV